MIVLPADLAERTILVTMALKAITNMILRLAALQVLLDDEEPYIDRMTNNSFCPRHIVDILITVSTAGNQSRAVENALCPHLRCQS